MPLGATIRDAVRAVEEWWFDATRAVRTAGNVPVPDAGKIVGQLRDSQMYAPVRTANAHAALRDLPIDDYSKYTLIDMGSGKGRVLFVAAEYPFRRVLGVEFSTELHRQALDNLARYRHRGRRCGEIEAVHCDAAEFEFPDGPLVIYMFNPFGPEVMGRMLTNLDRSLGRSPRHVVVVMLWPEHWELVAGMESMREFRKTRRHHVYQTAG